MILYWKVLNVKIAGLISCELLFKITAGCIIQNKTGGYFGI